MWKQWINFLLGLAVIAMAYMGGNHVYRYVVAGAVVAILALWAALEKKSPKQGGSMPANPAGPAA